MSGQPQPPVDSLLDIQREGVAAILATTERFSDADWSKPSPCEGWTALDLAGHVLTVANNWHILLDDSEARAPAARFKLSEMNDHFKKVLAALPEEPGPARIEQFEARINACFDRVADLDPELPLVSALTDISPVPVTIGLFAWLGGVEWHVHAWDFAQVLGESYQTPHAKTIHAGASIVRGFAPTEGNSWEEILSNYRPQNA